MVELQRITTAYSDTQDRMRITGEATPDETVELWITQRLLNRLLTHLFTWLVQQAPEQSNPTMAPQVQAMQSFAQQAAAAVLQPQPPVVTQLASKGGLVHSVDVRSDVHAVRLAFRAGQAMAGVDSFALTLQAQPLRQWLNILHAQYRLAEWPLSVWPQWMNESSAALIERPSAVWH